MQGKRVAILETRTGAHLGDLIARRGGVPLLAPALAELPDLDPDAIAGVLRIWRTMPIKAVIFQTGVGTKALFHAAEQLGVGGELFARLAESTVVVRGPKPTAELNARQVRIDLRAGSPFTTADVLAAMAPLDLKGEAVLIQRYGADNPELRAALEARGARVAEIATYRWGLPDDLNPMRELLRALAERRLDAVVFTSAVQIHHLFEVARRDGREQQLAADLNACVIASIGPVSTRALASHGVRATCEASPPKLGFLLTALEAALAAGLNEAAGAGV
jgi:uroporphyrinogen-III synthase